MFCKVNILFVLSFKNKDDRTSFSKYYMPTAEIKDYNVLINGKSFFDIPIKYKEKPYENITEMSKNNDGTTGPLLDYDYFSKHYRLVATDLSRQIVFKNTDTMQQINVIGRLDRYDEATIFFIIERTEETNFEFLQNTLPII